MEVIDSLYNTNSLIHKELEAFTINAKELKYINKDYSFSGNILFATFVKDGNVATYTRIYKNMNIQLMDLGMISCAIIYWTENNIHLSYIASKTDLASNFHLIIQYK